MNKLMTKLAVLVTGLALAGNVMGQDPSTHLAFDSGSNYDPPTWQTGANEGFGFGEWTIATGGSGNQGAFIGNPADGGISGMSATSFGLFANPSGGNFVTADRTFSSALGLGDVFSFDFGVNFDSDGDGNKGVNLYVGGIGGTEVININQGDTETITINGNTMFAEYGTAVMNLSFERVSSTDLRVFGTGRDGSESFDNTFTFTDSSIDAFRFYASDLALGDERQPYFDNLSVIPEPSSIIMMGLAGLAVCGLSFVKRRKNS